MKENTPAKGYPFLFLVGFITAFVAFAGLHTANEMRYIEKNGQLAAMHTDSVVPGRKKEQPKLYLSYKGQTYVRTVGEMEKLLYTRGNIVKVRYIPGDDYVILPSDHPSRAMNIAGFFFGLGALFALFNVRAFVRRMIHIMRSPSNSDQTLWK